MAVSWAIKNDITCYEKCVEGCSIWHLAIYKDNY